MQTIELTPSSRVCRQKCISPHCNMEVGRHKRKPKRRQSSLVRFVTGLKSGRPAGA